MRITFNKKVTGLTMAVACVISAATAWSSSGGGGSSGANKLIVGDSIFALSGDIHRYLERDLNENINTVARSGCQVLGGNFLCPSSSSIPNQYSKANKSGISTVIFNGGGNDFLLGSGGDCTSNACVNRVLGDIEAAITSTVNKMKSDGITQILYLGYYDIDDDNSVNEISMPYKAANYPQQGIKFVETRFAFRNDPRGIRALRVADGIHPSAAGSEILSRLNQARLD